MLVMVVCWYGVVIEFFFVVVGELLVCYLG